MRILTISENTWLGQRSIPLKVQIFLAGHQLGKSRTQIGHFQCYKWTLGIVRQMCICAKELLLKDVPVFLTSVVLVITPFGRNEISST